MFIVRSPKATRVWRRLVLLGLSSAVCRRFLSVPYLLIPKTDVSNVTYLKEL